MIKKNVLNLGELLLKPERRAGLLRQTAAPLPHNGPGNHHADLHGDGDDYPVEGNLDDRCQ